jgi:hypothetical protein
MQTRIDESDTPKTAEPGPLETALDDECFVSFFNAFLALPVRRPALSSSHLAFYSNLL